MDIVNRHKVIISNIYLYMCVYDKKKGRQHLFYVSKYTSSLVEYNSLLYYLLYKHKCESQRSCCFFFCCFFNSFEMIRALFLQEDTWKWSFWSYLITGTFSTSIIPFIEMMEIY